MSMAVAIEGLASVVETYGPTAYAVVSNPDGAPRITHVRPKWVDGDMEFGLGQTSLALLAAVPALGLVWPATADQPLSLIVDGVPVGKPSSAGVVRIRPVAAVRHRPAP